MNKQFQILKWIYENQNNFPLKSGKIFQAYKETEGYEARQQNFSELLSKLYDKNLTEKVEYGTYDISDKGIRKVETYLNKDQEEIERPESYKEVVDELDSFLFKEMSSQIQHSLLSGETLVLSLKQIDRYNLELLEEFFQENPSSFIDALEDALARNTDNGDIPEYKLEPDLEWLDCSLKNALNSSKLGEPVIVTGVIRRAESISSIVESAVFECSQCGDRYEKEQDSGKLKSPYKCDCGSRKFKEIEKKPVDVIDIQVSQRDSNETKMDARIKGSPDLDEQVQKDLMTGVKVKLLGVPRLLESKNKRTDKNPKRLDVLDFQRVDKKKEISEIDEEKKTRVLKKIESSDNPFKGFYTSLAPHMGDLDLAKKCVAISLVGAPEIEIQGSKDYGRMHTAIISNPGMGKSGLQDWVHDTFEKMYQTQGQGGTGTGLTGTVEQTKGGEWKLVAGKLVFADRGVLQIDEFDKFKEGELTSLNTAMESGTFSIDKASVSADLQARATVIASGNFSVKLTDSHQAYELLPEKGEGLYDRFALICGLTESGTEAKEKIDASFLAEDEKTEEHKELFDTTFDKEELRVYRHLAKNKSPKMSRKALQEIKNYAEAGQNKENPDIRGQSNRTYRNLIKLTLCVSRFNLREKATVEDAKKAKVLMRECKSSLDLGLNQDANSKRKRSKVLDRVERLDKDEGCSVEELKSKVTSETNLDYDQVGTVIDDLRNDGELFEPKPDFVSIVEG